VATVRFLSYYSLEVFMVVGCDASESSLALARQAQPAIDFFAHDILHPLPSSCAGCYDAVVSIEVVEHLVQPRHLIANAYGALRPGHACHQHSVSPLLEKPRFGAYQ
jgi:2-polyprenyl-3-methyl-5-hydroxy-6-metoxy-1,4-benzoquinol methylase